MKKRRGPGVVVDHERAAGVGDTGNGGDVRHLKGLRSRRLDQYCCGGRPEQFLNARANQWVVIGGLYAEARQKPVAEIARGPVDVVADQNMIAGLGHRQQGCADCRQPGRRKAYAGALGAFERHQRFLQRLRGWRAVTAVLVLAAVSMQVFRGWIEHRGTVHHRWVYKTLLGPGVAACRYQSGFSFLVR